MDKLKLALDILTGKCQISDDDIELLGLDIRHYHPEEIIKFRAKEIIIETFIDLESRISVLENPGVQGRDW